MKKLFLLLTIMGAVVVGCSKDEFDKGNDNKTEQSNENDIPEIIFFGLDKESITFSPDGGNVDIIVYSNYKWEISGTSDWCNPSIIKGNANEDGQKVTFTADVAHDDREATFWFRCADEKIKFVVMQKLKAVIIPNENNNFTIPAEGGIAVISYETTVDCEVLIPKEAQGWITIAPETRGFVSESITLDISENITYDTRSAVIKVVAKDNPELVVEYTINQEQSHALLADENNTSIVPGEGGEVVINYQTNVDCEIIIPAEAQGWITIAPKTRGLVSESIILDIAENTTCYPRSAVIKVVAKDNPELVVEHTINQEQNHALLADENNTFIVPGEGGEVVINYQTNVDCEIIIPAEAQGWITIAPATRGLVSESIVLDIAENTTCYPRSAVVRIAAKDVAGLVAEYTITQNVGPCLLYYTSFDGKIVTPYNRLSFDATILSNTYEDGVGVIKFDAPITSIGQMAFLRCGITSITIPNSVTTIESYAFSDCRLTRATIPDSVTTIGSYAFSDCRYLASITLGDSVTAIGDYAFSNCTKLTSVTIPDGVTEIGKYAFVGCGNLTKVTIGDSVTKIGERAFSDCKNLTSVTIPDSVTEIGSAAFCNCSSISSVTIPSGVTSIGGSAFSGCSSLTSVTIPSGVTSIGGSAFSSCRSLTSVTIPDGVTEIGEFAFSNCSSLTSVTIPSGVTSIGEYAFSNCSSLTSVYCKPTTPPVTPLSYDDSWKAFDGNASIRKIYVPMESESKYKTGSYYWSNYADAIVGYDF